MRTRVKICGITRAEDAALCVEAGVDALGFNFWPGSKRHVRPEQARDIAAALPAGGAAGRRLRSRAPPAEVREVVRRVGLGAVQLHGDEDPADYRDVGAALWQVLRVERTLPAGRRPHDADAVLLDARVGGLRRRRAAVRLEAGQRGAGLEPTGVARRRSRPAQRRRRPSAPRGPGASTWPPAWSPPRGRRIQARVRAFVTAVRAVEGRTMTHRQRPGRFGPYGGRYVPETLIPALDELAAAWESARSDPAFRARIAEDLRDWAGRPTPLTFATRSTARVRAVPRCG